MNDTRENNVLLKAELFSVVPNLLKIPTLLCLCIQLLQSAISYAKFVCNKAPFRVWVSLNLLVKCKLSIALVAAVIPRAGRAPSLDCSSRCVSSQKCVGWEILHPVPKGSRRRGLGAYYIGIKFVPPVQRCT